MAIGILDRFMHHLRRVALASDGGPTDGQLLECFITQQDESAFAELVRRHGPMVFGVCLRVLGNPADAEDAFQATFLILVRKAATLGQPEQVGNWLYGVAYRTALEARGRRLRRQAREQSLADFPPPAVMPEISWSELRPVLDQELDRLPTKYRTAVVLCDLEGRSRKEAAAQLRIPEGTLSSRLATARKTLAARLARRGVTLSATALATVLTHQATAAVPVALMQSTVQVATLVAVGCAAAPGAVSPHIAVLVKGVMQNMFLTKIKLAVASVAAVAFLGAGALFWVNQVLADKPEGNPPVQRDGDQPKKPAEGERDTGKAPQQGDVTVTGKVSKQDVERKTDDGGTRTFTFYYLTEASGNKIQLPRPRVSEAGEPLDKFDLEDFVGKEVTISGRGVSTRAAEGDNAPTRVVKLFAITAIKPK